MRTTTLLSFLMLILSVVAACKYILPSSLWVNKRRVHALTLMTAPPLFCKCTCFTNSKIIQLSANSPSSSPRELEDRAGSPSCSMCNRAFCREQRLPICKDAEEEDIFTTCFQRDSRKDQIVVITFIVSTLGLLGWAGVRKIIEKRKSLGGWAGGGSAARIYCCGWEVRRVGHL